MVLPALSGLCLLISTQSHLLLFQMQIVLTSLLIKDVLKRHHPFLINEHDILDLLDRVWPRSLRPCSMFDQHIFEI